MAAAATWIPEFQNFAPTIEWLARKGLILSLFFIGSNLTMKTLKSVGLRPFLQGLSLWLIVLTTTLVLIKFL